MIVKFVEMTAAVYRKKRESTKGVSVAHIVRIHVYFDEKWIRPIFKQEKRKWVAVSLFQSVQRTATPTVKPFLRVHLPEFLGGLLKAIFPFSGLQIGF